MLSRGKFPSDDGAFPNPTAAVISQRSSLTNDAVARDDEGDRIGADRTADGAGSPGLTDCGGKAPVGRKRPGWHPQERTPNSQLERRPAEECPQGPTGLIFPRLCKNFAR